MSRVPFSSDDNSRRRFIDALKLVCCRSPSLSNQGISTSIHSNKPYKYSEKTWKSFLCKNRFQPMISLREMAEWFAREASNTIPLHFKLGILSCQSLCPIGTDSEGESLNYIFIPIHQNWTVSTNLLTQHVCHSKYYQTNSTKSSMSSNGIPNSFAHEYKLELWRFQSFSG